jgi:hypothetical protein
MARWSRTCRCGEVWSDEEWNDLPPIGRYLAGKEGWIELRTCVCGAALTVPASEVEHRAASLD